MESVIRPFFFLSVRWRLWYLIMAMASSADADFIVWGIDRTAYGPVELPTLVSWVKDERVTADTWVFACQNGAWRHAGDVPELQMFFRAKPGGAVEDPSAVEPLAGLDPRSLRRVKI